MMMESGSGITGGAYHGFLFARRCIVYRVIKTIAHFGKDPASLGFEQTPQSLTMLIVSDLAW